MQGWDRTDRKEECKVRTEQTGKEEYKVGTGQRGKEECKVRTEQTGKEEYKVGTEQQEDQNTHYENDKEHDNAEQSHARDRHILYNYGHDQPTNEDRAGRDEDRGDVGEGREQRRCRRETEQGGTRTEKM
ncbi:hypothetical protein Pcinc_011742 [Petrolisthes cinctipes]|uniref:Uncharacterized protein n=1 Tax=Petrolisthes cinctipes TaxID=88211 RepID=A0AAE1KW22_PETCI|nr:hypothetical protein Pcinc_011742 [Petrolisthes cinctipes]